LEEGDVGEVHGLIAGKVLNIAAGENPAVGTVQTIVQSAVVIEAHVAVAVEIPAILAFIGDAVVVAVGGRARRRLAEIRHLISVAIGSGRWI